MKGVGLTALETEVFYYVTEVKKSVTTVFIRSPRSFLCQHKIVLYNTFMNGSSLFPIPTKYKSPGLFHFAAQFWSSQPLIYRRCRKEKPHVCEWKDTWASFRLPEFIGEGATRKFGICKEDAEKMSDSNFCGPMFLLLDASWKETTMFFSLLYCSYTTAIVWMTIIFLAADHPENSLCQHCLWLKNESWSTEGLSDLLKLSVGEIPLNSSLPSGPIP